MGERTREGNDLYHEMTEAGVLDKLAMVFGQMNEPPGARLRVALSGLTIAEYFRDRRAATCCSSSTTSSASPRRARRSRRCLGRMPSAVGYQPNLAEEMGAAARAHHLDQEGIDHLDAGGLCPRRRLHRSRPGDDLRPPRLDHRAGARLTEKGIYPAVDPLASTSRILDPQIVGQEHYDVAQEVKRVLQRYKDLQDIIAILGVDELSDTTS